MLLTSMAEGYARILNGHHGHYDGADISDSYDTYLQRYDGRTLSSLPSAVFAKTRSFVQRYKSWSNNEEYAVEVRRLFRKWIVWLGSTNAVFEPLLRPALGIFSNVAFKKCTLSDVEDQLRTWEASGGPLRPVVDHLRSKLHTAAAEKVLPSEP